MIQKIKYSRRLQLISITSLVISLTALFVIIYSASSMPGKQMVPYAVGVDQNIIYWNTKTEYGILVDSFYVETGRIHRNQNLAELLEMETHSPEITNNVINKAKEVFDLRKIKAGNNYKVFRLRDSSHTPYYFVYEDSPVDYLKINLHSLHAEKGAKEIRTVKKEATGIIQSSLWNTMIDNQLNPMMAIRLSEIYAWTVDFFGLEKGDAFKVIYEEEYVDSLSIGIGNIYAATFYHKTDTLHAFQFMQDSTLSYFDNQGQSLKRQFLKAPLRFSRISSGFSRRRFHPILKIYRPHSGVDYAAPTGTPIHAIGDGTVIKKGYTKGAGYYIKIRHNSVYTTGYNHLSRYGKGMKVGKRVHQGDVIGYVGSTGYATGPHLDFRMWKHGHAINPLKVEAPPVEPVKEENHEKFQAVKEKLLKELNRI